MLTFLKKMLGKETMPELPEEGGKMYIIVGLGNPGRKYDGTKHNMGFDVIDALIEKHRIPLSGTDMKGMYGKGMIAGQKVLLVKPMTYMNLSGECVQPFCHYYKIDPETELIVIYDDIDLEPGGIRVRKKGTAGSHNGMKSVIGRLGTTEFPRVRVGIGGKPSSWDLADYVLAPFDKDTRISVDKGIEDAVTAVEMILADDLDGAMNRFNKKPKKEKKKKEKKTSDEAKTEKKVDENESIQAAASGEQLVRRSDQKAAETEGDAVGNGVS